MAIVRQDSSDKYTLLETLKTRTGSKTMALDPKTHNLYLPAADFKAPNNQPKARPAEQVGNQRPGAPCCHALPPWSALSGFNGLRLPAALGNHHAPRHRYPSKGKDEGPKKRPGGC